jgi:elongation factor P
MTNGKGVNVIATSDFKKGIKILFRDEPYMVLEYHHVKPGKGGAFVRTKMKNMLTGLIREELFRSGEKFPNPNMEYRDMQYLYKDGDDYHFLDQGSYDQVALDKETLEDVLDFLKEQEVYTLLYFSGKPIAVNPPMFLELKVVDSPLGVKGDTAQGAASKPATLETGLVLNVPLFVEEGDSIKVDTRTSSYVERVKK